MSEVIVINVVVGDRTYRLKVNKNDEGVVRKTVKLINDQIVFFKTNFAGKADMGLVNKVARTLQ